MKNLLKAWFNFVSYRKLEIEYLIAKILEKNYNTSYINSSLMYEHETKKYVKNSTSSK